MNTYTVTVTDYVTNESKSYTIAATSGDAAYEEACRRLDPTDMHTIGGSYHRNSNDWGLR